MKIFPAVDLFQQKAVRLFKGQYDNMTVYSNRPWEIAEDFENSGSKYVHLVDLEGAKNGTTPNMDVVKKIIERTNLFYEIGGGIRDIETVEKYFDIGINRVILGTSAVTDERFLDKAINKFGEKIAVGIDVLDGCVAIKGWVEKSKYDCFEFFEKMINKGVKTIICTDISKDGAMQGTNLELYKKLQDMFSCNIVASGGVSNLEDIKRLSEMNMYGAIIGKAYYTKTINLKEALEVANDN
jgi:phosphoribosylformimino-5-aminoimidazole carboxamide ribotide isomerase